MDTRTLLIAKFLERNSRLNLSAIRDAHGVYEKHIIDALTLVQFDVIQSGMTVADVGTGGGWPLLALAQQYPDTHFVGIDARAKKLQAVQAIALESGLSNVQIKWGRIEQMHERYDIVTARAVAYADVLLDWIHPLVKTTGMMILYKLDTDEENGIIITWCQMMGYMIVHQYKYTILGDQTPRVLWILQKG